MLSEAVAETVTDEPDTVEPDEGVVREMVGGVVSEGGGVPLVREISICRNKLEFGGLIAMYRVAWPATLIPVV